MKQLFLSIILLTIPIITFAQQDTIKPKLYDPIVNAEKEISDAIALAKKQNKHVFLQIGGNWCVWCIRFHNFVQADSELANALNNNYVVAHINYSKENKNDETMRKLEYPNRFGFPVFVILDAKGRRIHTQNSAYLEEEKSYSRMKILDFFKSWSPAALNPANYDK